MPKRRGMTGGLARGSLFDTNIKATTIDEDIFSDQEALSSVAGDDLVLILDVSETPDKVKYITKTNLMAGVSTITVTDNESTDESNLITFVADAATSTGAHGLEMDGNLNYNPNSGNLSATLLTGTLQTASQANVTTLAGVTSIGAAGATTDIAAGDVTMYNAVNNGNPSISIGSSSAERFLITPTYTSGAQLLDYVKFSTVEASSTANRGKYIFDVDGTDIATIDDGGIDLASGMTFAVNGTDLVGSPITALNGATESELVTIGSTTTELDSETNLTFASNVLQIGASADIEPRLDLLNDENSAQIGIANATDDMVTGSADGDLVINSVGDHNVIIAQADTKAITLDTDGDVTFANNIDGGTWLGTTIAIAQGGTGTTSLNNLITLGTHTTGDYVTTVTAGTGLTSTGATSGESIAHSLSVDAAQSGITSVGTLTGLTLDGDKSVTPGDGSMIHLDTSTITDSNTSGSGTAAKYTHVTLEAPTLAATNSSVTTSDAATLYINAAATAGTNQTITRNWAMWVDTGNVRFDGSIYSGTTEAINSSGLVTVTNQSNIAGVGTITSGTWQGTDVGVAHGGTGVSTLTANGVLIGNGTSNVTAVDMSTKGKLLVGDGSGNPQALSVGGSDDHVLTIDSGEATGMKWAAVGAGSATSLAATSSSANEPVVSIENTHADATAGFLKFIKNPGSGQGADNDTIGTITFYGTDAGDNAPEELARMEAYIIEADDGSEAGGIKFYVAENDATMTAGLQILGVKDADGEIDVTIGAGAASTTIIAGTLTMGSTAAMTNAGLVSVANQSSITGLGTVSSGTWEATDVAVVHGGTGASSAGDARTNLGLGTAAVAATGISNTNVPVFTSGVADDDFLRVDGTSIEGRSASEVLSDIGGQASLTFGISNTNAVKIDAADVADDEYARFTANGLESRTAAEVAADIEGSIDAVGTIASGTWEGTDVGVAHGGTGVSTLLSNAILTGNGATDIQAEADLLFSSNKLIPTASAHDAAGTTLTMSAGATTAGTTNNIAGGALTFQGGQGKGSGAGGDIVFQTANAAGSGSSLNALATALTISDNLNSTFANDILLGSDNAVLSLGADADATFTHDGTTGLTIAANPFEVDSGGNITLDSHTGIWIFQDANTEMLRITESGSGDITIKLETDAKDLIFTDNNDDEGFRILDGAAGVNVAGDITMAADKSIKLPQGANVKFTDAITQDSIDDHDAQGIIMTFQAGSTVTPFSPVYLHTDDEVHECNADAIATMPCIGVSVNTSNVTDGNPVEVMMLGLIRDESFTDFGTNGAPVYVSTTVGTMTNTAPSGEDEVVQVIGHSVGEKLLFVQPCLTTIEHAA